METQKKWILRVLSVVVLIGALAFLNKPNTSVINEPIKIGGLFGQTGFVAFAGETSRNGFIMAIEDSGLDIEYVIEDTESDVSKTVTAVRRLIDISEVDVIIGPEWAEWGEVAAPIGNTAKVPIISPWMTSEFEWAKLPYYFSATPSERGQVREVLDHMTKSGHKNIALFENNSSWSLDLAEVVRDEVNENYNELTIVFDSKTEEGTFDYRTELLKLHGKDIDAIYSVISGGSKPEALTRQISELQINLPVYMPAGSAQSLLSNRSDPSIGEGVFYTASEKYEKTDEFNEKYFKRFGVEPVAISGATSYDMTTLVIDAIREGATSGEEIREYLTNIDGYVGYSNVITFNENGQQALEETELRQVQGDSYVKIE